MIGPTILMPCGWVRGQEARPHSSSNTWRCAGPQPVPPYSTGQPGAAQPPAYSCFCQ